MNKNDKEAKQEAAPSVVPTDAEVLDDTAETSAVVPAGETATAVATTQAAGGLGCFASAGPTVIDWSWVHLAFEMSKKKPADGNQGDFYLGKDWEVKLCDKGTVKPGQALKESQYFDFIVVGRYDGLKHYTTQAEFAAGMKPVRYPYAPTVKEARAAALKAGERLDWHDGDPAKGEPSRVGPTASPYMQLLMLVRKPEMVEDDALFTIPLDGEFYAPATFEFDKGNWEAAYGLLSRVLAQKAAIVAQKVAKGELPKGSQPDLFDRMFRINSSQREGKKGMVTYPVLSVATKDGKPVTVTEAAREDLRILLAGAQSGVASSEEDAF